MRIAAFFAAVFLLISAGAVAAPPSPSDIKWLHDYGSVDPEDALLLRNWFDDLKRELKTPNIDRAAARLAPRYGLAAAQMKQLILLWIRFDGLPIEDGPEHSPAARAVHRDAAAFAAATHYRPLAVEAAAAMTARFGRCDADDLWALAARAPDPVSTAWLAVRTADCPVWYRAFAARAPQRWFGALERMSHRGTSTLAGDLALDDFLASDAALAHVAPADRGLAQAHLAYARIEGFWSAGLFASGIAAFEALPATTRNLLLDGNLAGHEIKADDLAIRLGPQGYGPKYFQANVLILGDRSSDNFRVDLAAAYFVLGRDADAKAAIARVSVAARARAFLACAVRFGAPVKASANCPEGQYLDAKFLMLDLALSRPSADPYDLLETYYSSSAARAPSGEPLWAAVVCRLFAEPRYSAVCDTQKREAAEHLRPEDTAISDTSKEMAAMLAVVRPPHFEQAQASYAAAIAKLADALSPAPPPDVPRSERSSDAAPPPRFIAQELPVQFRGPVAAALPWPSGVSLLPQGFAPVRIAVGGRRAVAISLSQDFDPTGEVSEGGYWVHVSDDGGKTWQAPLYTGLSQLWPYEVMPASKMKLIDGDTLDIEVRIRELDTGSITYPPVALRTRRTQDNLYLKIPLAELRRDSDSDGITDIAEEHLLLDPHNPDTDGDGIPDGRDPMPNVPHAATAAPLDAALALILEKITGAPSLAIVESVDHGSDIGKMIAGERRAPDAGLSRPIFVAGRATDFAGFSPRRAMLVYSDADLERLRRLTPDFHALWLGEIVFDRAGDAGFVRYGNGFSGGTYRLRRRDGAWAIERVSFWIS
ncbi:MAG TPA: thrombospondin type 3 repeat-containing protein [Rhizomicrobium sp.]|jgi:hypothetical protein|nr:thrombospondin type 3 repeat-containing protein [Rhizomicrobium sp.]